MKDKTPVTYFEELGEKFDTYMSDYDVEQRKRLVFSSLLKNQELKGAKILEVGCGTGKFSEEIVKLGGDLTVLDIGPILVDQVKHKLSCSGVVGDACKLPFAARTFDLVISSECIEHTLNPERAVREMCRVCRSGGLVVITSPNKLWCPALVVAKKLRLRKFSGIENWIYPRIARRIMLEEGMTNIVLSGCHLWPFQLKFTHLLLRRFDTFGMWLYPIMINFGIRGYKHM